MNQDDERAEVVNRAVDSLDFPDTEPQATTPAAPRHPRAARPRSSLLVNVVVFLFTLLGGVLLGGDGHRHPAAAGPQHLTARRRPVHQRR